MGRLRRSAEPTFWKTRIIHNDSGAVLLSSPRRFRGSARLRLGGEYREAVHDLDQSLAIDPAQPLVLLQKGQALLKLQVEIRF